MLAPGRCRGDAACEGDLVAVGLGHGAACRGLLSPAGRELVDALGAKIDREFRGTDAERDELKLHGVRKLAEKEAREGPVDPAYVCRQAAAWEVQAQEKAWAAEQVREAARAPAPLLLAWRDPTGLSKAALDTLKAVQIAGLTAKISRRRTL